MRQLQSLQIVDGGLMHHPGSGCLSFTAGGLREAAGD
jgi:hypothetical protein